MHERLLSTQHNYDKTFAQKVGDDGWSLFEFFKFHFISIK